MLCRIDADGFFKLCQYTVRISGRQIDFVDNWNELEIIFYGNVDVGNGLCLDTLCGIDNK